jgi:hypothetical protein
LLTTTVNLTIIVAFLAMVGYLTPRADSSTTNTIILTCVAYIGSGYAVCRLVKVTPAGWTAELDWSSRVSVRLYYLWLRPLNVTRTKARGYSRPE